MKIEFRLNNKDVNINVSSNMRLVDVLRDEFGLLSVHSECGRGECGRCTVLLDNQLAAACMLPMFKVKGKEVMTFEGFSKTPAYEDISKGFQLAGCFPCRHCETPRILAAHSLLDSTYRPEETEIAGFMSFLNCHCLDFTTLFYGIIEAGRIREERVRER